MLEIVENLSVLEQSILQVERGWWKIARTRERAIRQATELTPIQYYVVLASLLDDPRFWKADPVLVDRLRTQRDKRLRERGEGGDYRQGNARD